MGEKKIKLANSDEPELITKESNKPMGAFKASAIK